MVAVSSGDGKEDNFGSDGTDLAGDHGARSLDGILDVGESVCPVPFGNYDDIVEKTSHEGISTEVDGEFVRESGGVILSDETRAADDLCFSLQKFYVHRVIYKSSFVIE